MEKEKIKFAYFGTDEFSVAVLEELKTAQFLPLIIVTVPDRAVGRGLVVTPPPAKQWAQLNGIEVLQPEKLDSDLISKLSGTNYDLFIVASYGKIIPKSILDIPKHGTLNVHPSLLPKYRGPSPIEYQILNDEQEVGVSIMLLDEKMDHGPILAQTYYDTEHNEQLNTSALTIELARRGGALLAKIIPDWLKEKITPKEQEHDKATITKKITKEEGLINLSDNPYQNYLKYLAYDIWPGTYFFTNKYGSQIRIKIKEAGYENGEFKIIRVVPEGGREMNYEDFLRGE